MFLRSTLDPQDVCLLNAKRPSLAGPGDIVQMITDLDKQVLQTCMMS